MTIKYYSATFLLIGSIVLTGCKEPTQVGEVIFLDSNFDSCVTTTYHDETPLSDVVELNCQSSPIASLSGAEWLQGLKIMRLNGPNHISDLKPLSELPNFSVLSLYGFSSDLIDIEPMLESTSFTEFYVENGPYIKCDQVEKMTRKLGENYALINGPSC